MLGTTVLMLRVEPKQEVSKGHENTLAHQRYVSHINTFKDAIDLQRTGTGCIPQPKDTVSRNHTPSDIAI
jgi:hypothetical protein